MKKNWLTLVNKQLVSGRDCLFSMKTRFLSLVISPWLLLPGTKDQEPGTKSSLTTLLLPNALWLVITFLFVSCDQSRVYEENVDFADKKWVVDSVPAFEFEIEDPSKPYNIYWNVRNTVAYPYRNLYLTYYLEDTTGRRITTDLHNMVLFEPKTGKPYGSGLGDIFSHQFMALPDFKFDEAGVYRVRLEQYMRTDTLPEIVSVGLRVEDAEVGS